MRAARLPGRHAGVLRHAAAQVAAEVPTGSPDCRRTPARANRCLRRSMSVGIGVRITGRLSAVFLVVKGAAGPARGCARGGEAE